MNPSGESTTRKLKATIFKMLCFSVTFVGIAVLIALIASTLDKGLGVLRYEFLANFPSRLPQEAGIKSALAGTLWVITLTAALSFPLGVGAAIYLEEYAPRNRLTQLTKLNIANLAGVPSIVYGILGLALFVRALSLERSVLAGALTLTLLVLPLVIITAQEALRAVPSSLREASYALGATKWQTVYRAVLRPAFPGILTGTILALSRAMGETAPLIMIGALSFVAFTPQGPLDSFTALPIQIFNWASRPQAEFRELAAAAIIVLIVVLMLLNGLAIILRSRYEKKGQW